MTTRKTRTAGLHYYSNHLKQKLNNLRTARAAIVEAPSGYGKTTAVRDYLAGSFPQSTAVYSFTASVELPEAGFRRLCLEIEKIDSRTGARLLQIGFPNAATIGDACDALRSMECSRPTWLVIDNFHFLGAALPPSFVTALLEHGGEGLHVIIITRKLERDIHTAIAGRALCHLTAADLRLHAGDIHRYFDLAGAKITLQEAKRVARYTEGWIIAVYLQLCAFRDTGGFSDTSTLLLMERLVWDVLTEDQQAFLLRLSPFENVTVQQACILAGCDSLPEYAAEALHSPFIRYESPEARYEINSLLSELLTRKRIERGVSFDRDCLRRAGDYCRGAQRTAEALDFYAQIEAYEQMLCLDFSQIILEEIRGRQFPQLALQIARNCPAGIKKNFPLSMLRIAWTLLLTGQHEEFAGLLDELSEMLEAGSGEENVQLRAEWTLLHSYRSFPDLPAMTAVLQQAENLFGGKTSRVIFPDAPWCFGDHFPFHVFHLLPGAAEREAEALEKYIALYAKLTNGHGSGGDVLYRAQFAFCRGDITGAEVLTYKAAYLAENKKQSVVLLGAAFLLAEIALYRADAAGWQNAVYSMERAISFKWRHSSVTRAIADITKGNLFNELGKHTDVAEWLKNGDFTEGNILPFMLNNALFVHLSYLLQRGEYARLLGKIQAVLAEGLVREPVSQILTENIMAVCYMGLGDREKAAACIGRSLETALPDGLMHLFAGYSLVLDGLVEQFIQEKHPHLSKGFADVKAQFETSWDLLHNALFRNGLPASLTAREYEVAKLAVRGLRNKEIGEELMITENTVRFHLRTVFQKLDIDRRARLREKLK